MQLQTIKKKLSCFVTEGGYLKNVPDDLLGEILYAWEEWPGSAKEFYSGLGFSYKKMASLIGKAKKLKREGHFGNESFKEINAPEELVAGSPTNTGGCKYIELDTGKGQIIRFPQVSQLMEYLDRVG